MGRVKAMAMLTRCVITMVGLLLAGCANKTGADPTGSPAPPADQPAQGSERPSLTTAECEARAGRVVGDIGDGAIHRPDYTCEGGQPPLGNIKPSEGEPIAVEGSVCCPNPS